MQAARLFDEVQGLVGDLASESWQTRQVATQEIIEGIERLGATERSKLIDRLIAEVVHPSTIGARAAAQEVLTHLGREVVPRVLHKVEARSEGARLLIDLIAFLGEEQDVARLKAIYEAASDDQNLQASIASVLGSIGGEEACAALWRMLDESSAHLRVFALDGLRIARFAADVNRLVDLAQDPLARKAAVALMGYCQDAGAAEYLVSYLGDCVRGVRSAALVSMGQLLAWSRGALHDRQRDKIVDSLADLSASARQQMVDLAQRGDREVLCTALEIAQICVQVELLGVAVERMDDGAVYERAMVLASICGESTLEFFRPWLDDPTKSTLLEPVYRLVAMSGVDQLDRDWKEHLLRQVQSGQMELASAAFEALGKCAQADVIPELREFCREDGILGEYAADAVSCLLQRHRMNLRTLLPHSEDPLAQWKPSELESPFLRNLCRIIGRTGADDAHLLLEHVLGCADVEARITAIVALGRVPAHPRSESLLRTALADEDAQARAAACRGLARLGICRAEAGLLSATEDPSAFVRAAAVQSLVALNCSSARERFVEMINAQDKPSVLVHAIEGLGKWGDSTDLDRLIDLSSHEDPEIVKSAVRALDHIQSPAATQRVWELLTHERWDVRWVCAESIKERVRPEFLDEIERAIRVESDPLVEETLLSAAELARKASLTA